MTKTEFANAYSLAKSDIKLHYNNLDLFAGYGLSGFETVYVTIKDVASLIRWQALQFNGQFNSEELHNIALAGKKGFIIIG